MAKRKNVQPIADPNGATQPNAPNDPPQVESPELVPPQSEPRRAARATRDAPAGEGRLDPVNTLPALFVPQPDGEAARLRRPRRWRTLSAFVAGAAALGGMAGSLATFGLAQWLTPAAETAAGALVRSVARIDTELTALKTTVEFAGKTTNAQFAHVVERLDQNERLLADPAAKIDRIGAALERLERRLPVTAATLPVPQALPAPHVPETTGTVLADVRVPLPPEPRRSLAPVVDGWSLQGVNNGAAVIKGRIGLVQVEPGDRLPGLGRIETIRRQDGRWVVVTSRGLIVAR